MFRLVLLCVCSVLLVAAYPNNNLADPVNENAAIDSFVYKKKEYILVNFGIRPGLADEYCSITFNGHLAQINTEDLAKFLAEALSETDHYLDNVWTSGTKKKHKWVWRDDGEVVDPYILEKYYINRTNEEEFNMTRECLAFRRDTQDQPKFLSLSCALPRPAICERDSKIANSNEIGSTHSDWIKIGDRFYKIYQDKVAYEIASKNCIRHDSNARLAVIETTEDAEKLARYMVIGRPKIENAWIGARWSENKYLYQFEEELSLLANQTNEGSRYPPWRDGEIHNKAGCVFVRRHLTGVHFIEAHCARSRPYICYKSTSDNKESHVVAKNTIAVYRRRSWMNANRYCKTYRIPGRLPEPRTEEDLKKLLYIMGESNIPLDQIWLGGLHYEQAGWKWVSDNNAIPANKTYPPWLNNDTYTEAVEGKNRCLNLDRENHNVGVFYGADCNYPQRFICVFTSTENESTTTIASDVVIVNTTTEVEKSTTEVVSSIETTISEVEQQTSAETVVTERSTENLVTTPSSETVVSQSSTEEVVTESEVQETTPEVFAATTGNGTEQQAAVETTTLVAAPN